MKKLLIILIALISLNANAQVITMTGADTLTNAETNYLTATPTVFYETVSFQPVITKLSGTVAGYALLQSSNDNTNFIDVNTDTLTLANTTTNTKVWPIAYNNSLYYRIKIVTTGTVSATFAGYAFVSGGSNKHAVNIMKSSYGLTLDTATNSATTYLQSTVLNRYKTVSIQAVVTKLSGTVGGTVTVQGSLDGTNFVTVNSSFITSSTLTALNQTTTTKIFVVTGSPYKYYRLSYTGTGTMSATLKGYLVPNN